MAIGTAAAIGIGLAGVGSALGARSQNKAASRAADTSERNNQANVALAREIYGNNQQMLNPFMQRGNVAGNQINALLGLGGSQQQGGPQPATLPGVQPNALTRFTGGIPATQGYGLGDSGLRYTPDDPMATFQGGANLGGVDWGPADGRYTMGFGDWAGSNMGGGPNFAQYVQSNPDLMATATTGTAPMGQTPQQAAEGAFDIFRNSTGYQFRLGEGLDAVNSAYAGIGGLQSGAAMRGINEYGQNFASNEFGNYMNALGAQQAVGAGSASALAGVGQNFAGTVIGANNFNAQNQMSAQLGRQSVLGNALGTLGGGAFGFMTGGN